MMLLPVFLLVFCRSRLGVGCAAAGLLAAVLLATPAHAIGAYVLPTPVPTVAPPAPAALRQAAPPLVGDCNGDGAVTIDEIVASIGIVLGTVSEDRCEAAACFVAPKLPPTFSVVCVVEAVRNALGE